MNESALEHEFAQSSSEMEDDNAKKSPAPPATSANSDQKPNLDLIMKIPVTVQVLLGTTKMPVSKLMSLGRNSIIALDRHVDDPIDVVVNGRTIARGEVVLMEDDNTQFGISLTEVIESSDVEP